MTDSLNQRIFSDVIAVIRHILCLPDTPISAATRFAEDLGLDSFDLVEIGLEIEARFQIELPDNLSQRCQSVAQIAGYMSQRYFQEVPDAELECEPSFALAA
jgi:acyl carrier protein